MIKEYLELIKYTMKGDRLNEFLLIQKLREKSINKCKEKAKKKYLNGMMWEIIGSIGTSCRWNKGDGHYRYYDIFNFDYNRDTTIDEIETHIRETFAKEYGHIDIVEMDIYKDGYSIKLSLKLKIEEVVK